LTTLIVETESLACGATSVGRHRVPIGASSAWISGLRESLIALQGDPHEPQANLALWIGAGILAVVFLVASSTKLLVPKETQAGMFGTASRWVEDFSPRALKAIGAMEFLAAVGLILPAVLGIAPVLVPLAATGAVLLFTGAVIMRLRRGERATIIGDLVYLAPAAFVAWGRFGPGSFTRGTQRGVSGPARPRQMTQGGLPGSRVDSPP
jgi:hypothetical protein